MWGWRGIRGVRAATSRSSHSGEWTRLPWIQLIAITSCAAIELAHGRSGYVQQTYYLAELWQLFSPKRDIRHPPRQFVASLTRGNQQYCLFHTGTGRRRSFAQIPQQGFHLLPGASSMARFLTIEPPIWNEHHARSQKMAGVTEDHSG